MKRITLEFVDGDAQPHEALIGGARILVNLTDCDDSERLNIVEQMDACARLLSYISDTSDISVHNVARIVRARAKSHYRQAHGLHKLCATCGQQVPEE